jgi:dihydropteroate synthase
MKIAGIVNITPDSFSDGGVAFSAHDAIERIDHLIKEGADFIDIGADSTRPGSVCVGQEEEWRRLKPVLEKFLDFKKISIDTHHILTARRAVQCGVKIINDISGGSQELFELAADTGSSVIVMFSRCTEPHNFSYTEDSSILDEIKKFFDRRIELASQVGLPLSQLIFDPGMGSFISKDPYISKLVLDSFYEFASYKNLFLGVSRKGFIRKVYSEKFQVSDSNEVLDAVSAEIASTVCQLLPEDVTLFVRSHSLKFLKS